MRIVVTFDQDTNTARMGSDSSCELLFEDGFLALLGEGPTCIWRSPSALVISLGYASTVTTSAAARLEGAAAYGGWDFMLSITSRARVLAQYENSEPSASSVEIAAPDTFPSPTARIDAALRVGVCDDLYVSGERSRRRDCHSAPPLSLQ